MLDSLGKNYLKILLLLYILLLNHGIIIRVSGVQVPPPLPKIFIKSIFKEGFNNSPEYVGVKWNDREDVLYPIHFLV